MAEKLLKNRYLIADVDRDKLGAGSFGSTYLARDTRYRSFEKKVVVKHLQPPPGQFDIALKFFQREAEVLSKLGSEHGQIPTLVDFFDEGNDFYIVQEWIDGETLSGTLKYGQRLTQKDTIDLLIEILEPLKFCHDEGTIHRDLKPANLMRRRSDGQLVIIDFGAVREVGQLTLMPNGQERPGSRIGSPGYASPEQCAMLPSPVLASDIYAVGAIGIQAMTGLPPSTIITPFEEIPRWWEVPDRSNATKEFTEILNKMLAFSPKARYYDASAALQALRAITAKYPLTGENQTIILNSTPIQKPSVILQPQTVVPEPSSSIETLQTKFVGQIGKLSQEVFIFETAKLERVAVQKVEIIKKPRWLGIGEREERQTKTVQEWQTKKSKGEAERFTEDLGSGVSLEMVFVPAGSFTMGSEEYDKEEPRHVVNVPEFYMGRYQVTQKQYLKIMGKNPSNWQDANLPVERISWNDAQVFCQKLSAKTGKKYRLPSEAQWEYACRAKTDTPFYFGETISTELANYNGSYNYKSGVKGIYREKTTPVSSFPANGFGLHDMHGNVWEWCEDKWHENYQGAPTDGSAWISGNDNDYRLLRGGSWADLPHRCLSANRSRRSAGYKFYYVGFRIICDQDL
jgi:eukaryotic-like serine/threonine-protein kinase